MSKPKLNSVANFKEKLFSFSYKKLKNKNKTAKVYKLLIK